MGKNTRSFIKKLPFLFLAAFFIITGSSVSAFAAQSVYWTDALTGERINIANANELKLFPGEKRKIRLNADIDASKKLTAYQFTVNYDQTAIQLESVVDAAENFPFASTQQINISTLGKIAVNGYDINGISGSDTPTVSFVDAVIKGLSPVGTKAFDIVVEDFIDENTQNIKDTVQANNLETEVTNTTAKIFYTNADGITLTKISNLDNAGQNIYFNVAVPDAKSLGSYSFKLTYDTAYVLVESSTVKDVDTNGTVVVINDAVAGEIQFNGYKARPGIAGPQILRLIEIPLKAVNASVTTQLDTLVKYLGEGPDDAAGFIAAGTTQSLPIVTNMGTFTITATAGGGGTITPSGAISVNEGASQTFTIAANSGFQIQNVVVDGVSKGAISSYPFTNVTANHTISASFSSTGTDPGPGPSTNPPTANFEADVLEGEAPLTVKFTDKSTGATSWSWDFGDGTTSTLQNPEHEYTASGKYTVKLTVSNSDGSNTKTQTEYIFVTGKAAFKIEYKIDGDPMKVRFTDMSTGEVVSRKWFINGQEVGDGASAYTHTFTADGDYEIKLEITGDGWTKTITQNITVDSVVLVPAFEFTIGTANNLLVAFTDRSEPADKIIKRLWDFGDGIQQETAETTIAHTYAADGLYNVKLIISTASNKTAEISMTIRAGQPGGVEPGTITANFTATPNTGGLPLLVQFADLSTSTNNIIARIWDFGDGSTSFEANPTYEYKTAGTFTVKLTVVSQDGSNTKVMENFISATINPVLVVESPILSSPSNGQADAEILELHLVPTLKIADYADMSNEYGFTKWEISKSSTFEEINIIWRETTTGFSLTLPDFILDYGETYYWRAQFIDKNGLTSEWSQAFSFITAVSASDDTDSDGVLDTQKADCETVFAGINLMKCAKADVGTGVFGIEAVENLLGVSFFRTFGETYIPEEISMPWGLLGFKLNVTSVGTAAKVRIYLSEAAASDAEWYVNELWELVSTKRAGSSAAEWAADRKSVLLTLTDGGENDQDGIANGVIVVPFTGFGTAKAGGEVCCSGGGGDSCFISTAADAPKAGLIAVIALFGVVSAFFLRKNSQK